MRQVADEYHVSHETVRSVIFDATKEPVQHESQVYNSSLSMVDQAFPGSGHQTAQEEEIRRLKREVEILLMIAHVRADDVPLAHALPISDP